jgi:4-hydroxy-tetrahydrodipicolinate reductase
MKMNIGISGINGRVGQILKQLLVDENPRYAGLNFIAGFARVANVESQPPIYDDLDSFLQGVDLVIDFSLPENCIAMAERAAQYDVRLVSGTTGLSDTQMRALQSAAKHVPILHAGNMSLGVNLLCSLVEQASQRLNLNYDVEITETHHRLKRDAPSGTALMLGQAAASGRNQDHDKRAVYSREGADALRGDGEIGYAVRRGGSVIGAHDVSFFGDSEVLTLSHHAENRALFAEGALFAASWLKGQSAGRLYSMRDALNI